MLRWAFRGLLPAAITAIGLLAGCGELFQLRPARAPDAVGYSATLHRTEGGIPHIVAEDWAGLGYGTAYAVAQDHFCEQAGNILKFRARLAEHFGPGDGNPDSDFFFRLLQRTGLYDAEIDPEFDALFTGYAAGFNKYVRDVGADGIADPACAGADWIPEVTAEDIRRIHLTPAFLPGFSDLIVAAAPPALAAAGATSGEAPAEPASFERHRETKDLSTWEEPQWAALDGRHIEPGDRGSNGVAIGRELSDDGRGLLYTNPHLDWDSFDFRLYGLHQIIPGVTNMLGANQAQRANVGFGTNGDVAWTNTVSTSRAFMIYRLDLAPGNPLAYLFDGEERGIEAIEVTVKSLNRDGAPADVSHTFYRSHLGWMIGGPFPWSTATAFSLRIAGEGARGFQGGAIAMSRATTVRELKAAIDAYQSTPGNTIAADSSGRVLYGDLGPVANFTDRQLAECAVAGPVFRGNTAACEWNVDEDATAPGLLGAGRQAHLFRDDYVTNSNSSYWLANPERPLTGWPLVQGDIETERSLRTRSGLAMIEARRDGSDGLPGNTFNPDTLMERMLGNRNYAGQLLRDDLVTLCENNPSVDVEGDAVDISAACPVLADWDLASNLESRGAHLFREFMRAARTQDDGRGLPRAFNYATPFDARDAVNTPAGLDTEDNPAAPRALAIAVRTLNDAGIALDAPLGELQGVTRNGEFIPLPGGEEFEGVFNKMSMDFAGGRGYPEVTGSSASWVMVTRVAGDNTRVKGAMSYSQSSDPTSAHYADLTRRFGRGELVDIPFTRADVEAAALSTMELREGTDDCIGEGWRDFAGLGATDEASCRRYFNDVYNSRISGFVDD